MEFLDFAGFQVFTGPGGARKWNSRRIYIARAFSELCPISGAKMWNLCQIFIGSGISGFCRISSDLQLRVVQECEIWAEFSSRVHFFDFAQFWVKNVKFEPNFHRLWNFWIFPDFKCLQVREVQECEIREEFSSRVHFVDFAQFWGQKCEIWAKFSSPG